MLGVVLGISDFSKLSMLVEMYSISDKENFVKAHFFVFDHGDCK
jgi:hypothetical protein